MAKGLFPIHTKKGGTNRFGTHMPVYEKSTGPTEKVQDLDHKCRDEISKSGASVVILDLRNMKLTEEHPSTGSLA